MLAIWLENTASMTPQERHGHADLTLPAAYHLTDGPRKAPAERRILARQQWANASYGTLLLGLSVTTDR